MGRKRLTVKEPKTFEQCSEDHQAWKTDHWLERISRAELQHLQKYLDTTTETEAHAVWLEARIRQSQERVKVIEWLRTLLTNGMRC